MRIKFFSFHQAMLCVFLILTGLTLARTASAQSSAEEFQAPEDLHAYIVGLSKRNFHDLTLEQCQLFKRNYPDHALIEDILQLEIKANYGLKNYAAASQCIEAYLRKFPKGAKCAEYRLFGAGCSRETKDYAGAIELLRPLFSSKDEHMSEEARYLAADCHLAMGNTSEAEKILKELASLPLKQENSNRVRACYYFALKHHREGETQAAKQAYQSLLGIESLPDDLRAQILLNMGQLAFINLTDYRTAADYYGKFTAEYPSNPSCAIARRMLLICRFRLNDYDTFLKSYQDYSESYPKEAASDLELQWLDAQVLLKQKDYTKAMPLLSALAVNPALSDSLRNTILSLHISALYDTRRYQELLDTTRRYLDEYPTLSNKATILQLNGKAAEALHDSDSAIRFYTEAMPLFSENQEKYYETGISLAQLLEEKNSYAASTRIWNNLILSSPRKYHPQLHYQAAQTALKLQNAEEALEHLNRITTDFPESVPWALEAWKNIVQIALKNNLAETALSASRKIVTYKELTPEENLTYSSMIASILLYQKEYTDAVSAYTQAIHFGEQHSLPIDKPLSTLLQLELYLEMDDAAYNHGLTLVKLAQQDRLAAAPSPEVLLALAELAEKKNDTLLEESVLEIILRNTSDKKEFLEARHQAMLKKAVIHIRNHKYAEAKALVEGVLHQRRGTTLPESADAYALLAEIAFLCKDYATALASTDRALKFCNDTSWPETRQRALYIKARQLYEQDKALDAAFRCATLCFIEPDDTLYTPRALALAISICQDKGESSHAQELTRELNSRFPNFIK